MLSATAAAGGLIAGASSDSFGPGRSLLTGLIVGVVGATSGAIAATHPGRIAVLVRLVAGLAGGSVVGLLVLGVYETGCYGCGAPLGVSKVLFGISGMTAAVMAGFAARVLAQRELAMRRLIFAVAVGITSFAFLFSVLSFIAGAALLVIYFPDD